MTEQTAEQRIGVDRLRLMLPALASYYSPLNDDRDLCLVCGDCECGGACPGAMEVVHQVIDALGCGDDDWDWWRADFADEGIAIPTATPAPLDAREGEEVRDLIERSSLGTPEAQALRATVSDEHAARIVARSKELAREGEEACICDLPPVARLVVCPVHPTGHPTTPADRDER